MGATHLSTGQIKSLGAVYTPSWLVSQMIRLPHIDWTTARILDPACGDGSFLVGLAIHLLDVHKNLSPQKQSQQLATQLHGFDLDKAALAKAHLALDNLLRDRGLPLPSWSLHKLDSLNPKALAPWTNYFDLVIGNPPYVRIQSLGYRRRAQIIRHWPLASKGAADLYLAFFNAAGKLLKPQGSLVFITPNSYWHSAAGQPLRQFLATQTTLTHLVNFKGHQVFPDATTYASILAAQLTPPPPKHRLLYHEGTAKSLGPSTKISQHELSSLGQKWELALPASRRQLNAINPGGPTLGSVSRISTGLATLADAYYIFHIPALPKQKLVPVTTQQGRQVLLEKALLLPILKASTLKPGQTTQDLWILFPYQKVNNKHQIISEAILKTKYPHAYAYLKSIKPILNARDRGRPNPVSWYAFGRTQGLDHVFGPKLLTAPMNKQPSFIYRPESTTAFYSGYSVSLPDPTLLPKLAHALNTPQMDAYIKATSKDYQHGWKSYAKGFIQSFRLPKNWDR